jgi:hypothetical protein
MPDTQKPSILTRAMQNVDRKMGRTPADGEITTTESRTDVKNALIGAAVIAGLGTAAIFAALKFTAKAVIEEETASDETIED